jgi:hypothetical protein
LIVAVVGIVALARAIRKGRVVTAGPGGGESPTSKGEPRRPLTRLRAAVIAAVFVLPAVALALALYGSETLFDRTGMERTFARHYPKVAREVLEGSDLPEKATDRERLRALSRGIVAKIGGKENPFRRDLVITGSCLPPRPRGLDSSDLYFYLPAAGRTADPPSFGTRGVALADHPDILMDVVMGSGSIFPGFPPSVINDFPTQGEQVKLIDGGFAHNSPIEAAVQWGATHIILIEASPKSEQELEERPGPGGHRPLGEHCLAYNAEEAFNHLYDQAQLLDVRSRERVAIFTLRPRTRHLTTIDFSRGKIRAAVAAGREDAAGANFERQHGEPHFAEPSETIP